MFKNLIMAKNDFRRVLGAALVPVAVSLSLLVHFAHAKPVQVGGGPDGGEEVEIFPDAPEADVNSVAGMKKAFGAAFLMMLVSEIGDKTFFIAAIMAMRHSRLTVFLGAIGALAVMTFLSAYAGTVATFIPKIYTHYAVTALFIIFGAKMLKEGLEMSDDEGAEELEEVTTELKKKDEEMDSEAGFSRIFTQAFTMTFFAEWGDRSQIATIALGTNQNPLAVSIGAILGHSVCTCMAVMGGRLVAQQISVRTVTIIGAVVFIGFGMANLLLTVESEE